MNCFTKKKLHSISQSHQSEISGLVLNGVQVPETVLENILSHLSIKDMLTIRQVCKLWKDIVSRHLFWKQMYQTNSLNAEWTAISECIAEKDFSWMVFFTLFTIFKVRIIQNHSGHDGYNSWILPKVNCGYRMHIELPPRVMSALPMDSVFEDAVDSAFVTTFYWHKMEQKILLRDLGLTTKIMNLMVPFQFIATMMIGISPESEGKYSIRLELQNKNNKTILRNVKDGVVMGSNGWEKENCILNVIKKVDRAHCLSLELCGRCTTYGYDYFNGIKFARVAISIKCLTQREVSEIFAHVTNSKYDVERSAEFTFMCRPPPMVR